MLKCPEKFFYQINKLIRLFIVLIQVTFALGQVRVFFCIAKLE